MKLGKVVGTVVSTRKDEKIEGLKLFVVQDLSLSAGTLKEAASFVVAADAMGAGVGEVVLYASGSSARQTKQTDGRPIDAVIMAIVDTVAVGNGALPASVVYDKYTHDD
jgi:microcompartment protein CcmK/EutM